MKIKPEGEISSQITLTLCRILPVWPVAITTIQCEIITRGVIVEYIYIYIYNSYIIHTTISYSNKVIQVLSESLSSYFHKIGKVGLSNLIQIYSCTDRYWQYFITLINCFIM